MNLIYLSKTKVFAYILDLELIEYPLLPSERYILKYA